MSVCVYMGNHLVYFGAFKEFEARSSSKLKLKLTFVTSYSSAHQIHSF